MYYRCLICIQLFSWILKLVLKGFFKKKILRNSLNALSKCDTLHQILEKWEDKENRTKISRVAWLHTASKPPSPLKPLEVRTYEELEDGCWYLAGPNRNSIKDGLEHPKAPVWLCVLYIVWNEKSGLLSPPPLAAHPRLHFCSELKETKWRTSQNRWKVEQHRIIWFLVGLTRFSFIVCQVLWREFQSFEWIISKIVARQKMN